MKRILLVLGILATTILAAPSVGHSIDNKACMECHDDIDDLVDKFPNSVHSDLDCVECHTDLEKMKKDEDHETPLKPVNCASCHEDEEKMVKDSLHGQALERKDKLAPRCWNCHGSHDILPVKSTKSRVAPLKIPYVCGSCHSDNGPVAKQREIHQDHILENYSESMHAEGLFKKGLSVTATCVSCHTAHQILKHTDPRSSIAPGNVVKTCLKCHTQIEAVHRKVIKGELWEKQPKAIPMCVECHQPHKARKVFYDQGVADQDCLMCHSKPDVKASSDGRSLFVDQAILSKSIHAKTACAKCHNEVTPSVERACSTIKNKVNCAVCHSDQVDQYQSGVHGTLHRDGNKDAPVCQTCHGTHEIMGKANGDSPIFPTNVPKLCAKCHREDGKAALSYKGEQHQIPENYIESIHGKGLLKSGLVVTATCTSCHTAHGERPAKDPLSTVNPANIAITCSKCHKGVYETFSKSIHVTGKAKDGFNLPVCSDCHSAHTIKRTDQGQFRFEIMDVCGKCHKDIADTYMDTFHGKVSKLGFSKAAKCHDCHGSHEILKVTDPKSALSRDNIVTTCQKCHESATARFSGYLTHATHHDPDKYPFVFWTFWGMTALLVGTFLVSGLHTLMWLPRSIQMRKLHPAKPYDPQEKQYVRFPLLYRILHATMIVSFLTLATTGMTLKFSSSPWAAFLSRLLGGFEVTGFLHRAAAILLIGLFSVHIWDLLKRKKTEFGGWKGMLTGSKTILFTLNDAKELWQSLKWYVGIGERPKYGRWTYWEKFDYFAVFWGIAVIGCSGLMLWFPEFFTYLLPGWLINVATIVHSDEALLAAGFIFTIHFFNTHFRPEKFPMDAVIFTGRMPLEELERERPAEYEELVASGELEKHLAHPLKPSVVRVIKFFAWIALIIGISLIVAIIYAMLFTHI